MNYFKNIDTGNFLRVKAVYNKFTNSRINVHNAQCVYHENE